jgi:hypothetical protein
MDDIHGVGGGFGDKGERTKVLGIHSKLTWYWVNMLEADEWRYGGTRNCRERSSSRLPFMARSPGAAYSL